MQEENLRGKSEDLLGAALGLNLFLQGNQMELAGPLGFLRKELRRAEESACRYHQVSMAQQKNHLLDSIVLPNDNLLSSVDTYKRILMLRDQKIAGANFCAIQLARANLQIPIPHLIEVLTKMMERTLEQKLTNKQLKTEIRRVKQSGSIGAVPTNDHCDDQ